MSIDRVATNNQTGYMLSQIAKANVKLQQSQNQVTSGKIANDYSGIGGKTAALEGARAAAERASGYAANTQLAVTQTDLQDTQLTTLSGLAQQLQTAIQSAAGNSDGAGLMEKAKGIFDQASSILNSTDANGNYLYGGEIADKAPFTATSLEDLASNPSGSCFTNGTVKKSVTVADGQTQEIGVLASDVGGQLMDTLRSLFLEDQKSGASGDLSGKLTNTQVNDLSSDLAPAAGKAYTAINAVVATNGDTYKALQADVTDQTSLQNMYKGFVSDIEDADMATALTNLSNNQTALQAVLTVTSKLNDLSLLNYLPASG